MSLDKVGWEHVAEVVDVLAIDFLRTAKSDVDNALVLEEEVLGNLRGTWVIASKGSDESGRLAGWVELEVDRAHWKHGTLEGRQLGHDLLRLSTCARWVGRALEISEETVLEHEASLKSTLHEGKELSGARVSMRAVHATRSQEADGGGDALVGQDRKVLVVGREDAAALTSVGGFVKVEANDTVDLGLRDELPPAVNLDGEQVVELVDLADLRVDLDSERSCGRSGCLGRSWVDRDLCWDGKGPAVGRGRRTAVSSLQSRGNSSVGTAVDRPSLSPRSSLRNAGRCGNDGDFDHGRHFLCRS